MTSGEQHSGPLRLCVCVCVQISAAVSVGER